MALFSWVGTVEDFSPVALTVRAQQLDPNLQNRLLWDQFAPRQDVDSTELDEILVEELEVEFVSERREWNTRGRPIPTRAPKRLQYEFIPMETYFEIMEKEINDLLTRFRGNRNMMMEQIGPSIPRRTDKIAAANIRRIEKDFFDGWANGIVTRRNPQMGHLSQTFNFNFDTDRYPTATTAWNDSGLNAYREFLAAVNEADQWIGPCGGAIMRRATWNAIEADITSAIGFSTAFPLTVLTPSQGRQRLNDDLQRQFTILIFEDTLTVFNDGGLTNVTTVNRWPAEKIGFIPAANGGAVGRTAFAPVARAWDLTEDAPDAEIDVRGNTVFHDVENSGRQLLVECQLNAFPYPLEERVFVMDVGV